MVNYESYNEVEYLEVNSRRTTNEFEVDDAIKKLEKLDLVNRDTNGILTVLSVDEVLNHMDYIWDNYFDYNKPENK